MAQRYMKQGDALDMGHAYFPSWRRSRREAQMLGAWQEGKQYQYSESADLDPDHVGYGQPFAPSKADITAEYENLRSLSPNSFAHLLVTTLAQMAIIEGISRPGETGVLPAWQVFRQNRWLTKQDAIHRGALGQAVSYGVVLPGKDPLTGARMSKMLTRSAEKMSAFYDNDDDEWARLAVEAEPWYEDPSGLGTPLQKGWYVRLYDDWVIHYMTCEGDGSDRSKWEYTEFREHGMPVVPVARYANRINLDGRATGIIEPVLPILRRIDQDTFDRLINQRFGAWQVRYIAGMAKPDSKSEQAAQALKLRVEDLLVSTSEKTKFGTLPGGSIEPQIAATDHDLRLLSAISQMPPHHLLGLSSNLQAEALAAATEGLQRQAYAFRNSVGEGHEQMARLVALDSGDLVTAASTDLRIRWKDTESGSMSQAADSLGKLASTLGVPFEMLWERIPGWTDDDVQRAKELVENGTIEKLLRELVGETPDTGAEGPAGGDGN